MKIQQTNTVQYTQNRRSQSPSFGYLPICRGNIIKRLKNGTQKLLPVEVCLLREEDKPFMQKIYEKWTEETALGYSIIGNFINGKMVPSFLAEKCNYFVVLPIEQKTQPQSFFQRILKRLIPQKQERQREPLCIAEMENGEKGFELTYLQTAPEIMKANNRDKRILSTDHNIVAGLFGFQVKPKRDTKKPAAISGAGQMLMYGISRYVQSMKHKLLKINSQNDQFYERIFHCKKGKDNYFRIREEGLTRLITETRAKYGIEQEPMELPKPIVDEINNNKF